MHVPIYDLPRNCGPPSQSTIDVCGGDHSSYVASAPAECCLAAEHTAAAAVATAVLDASVRIPTVAAVARNCFASVHTLPAAAAVLDGSAGVRSSNAAFAGPPARTQLGRTAVAAAAVGGTGMRAHRRLHTEAARQVGYRLHRQSSRGSATATAPQTQVRRLAGGGGVEPGR